MHTHARFLVAAVALALGGAACSSLGSMTITGSGQNTTEDRQVGAFDSIAVADSLTAMITVAASQPQSIRVSGDSNLVPLVRATLSGTELTLDMPPNTNFSTKLPLVVTVSAQALHALQADSSAVAIADTVSGGDVTVESKSSAEVKVTTVTATGALTVSTDDSATLTAGAVTAGGAVSIHADRSGKLTATGLTASGAVTLLADNAAIATLGGSTPTFSAQVARSANLQAQNLSAASATITASASANAELCATASLSATLTTSSHVGYHCNPASVVKNVDQTSTLTME